jgi:hypothetical protein
MDHLSPITDELQQRIDAAYKNGTHYPRKLPAPVETVTVYCDVCEGYGGPIVHITQIPARFSAFINDVAIGSGCPAPDYRTGLLYSHDVIRWLQLLAVTVELVPSDPVIEHDTERRG